MQVQTHPQSGVPIVGMKLAEGAILQEGDVYDSTVGVWEQCPCPGLELKATSTFWVRPRAELSENARLLLDYLNLRGGDFYGCIAERNGTYYVIPSPNFNWDGRIDVESQRVQHPECVQELVGYGYLAFGEHAVSNWQSDYATVWEGHQNRVYTLTDEGKREGSKIRVQ